MKRKTQNRFVLMLAVLLTALFYSVFFLIEVKGGHSMAINMFHDLWSRGWAMRYVWVLVCVFLPLVPGLTLLLYYTDETVRRFVFGKSQ